jgi:hypothetical protein
VQGTQGLPGAKGWQGGQGLQGGQGVQGCRGSGHDDYLRLDVAGVVTKSNFRWALRHLFEYTRVAGASPCDESSHPFQPKSTAHGEPRRWRALVALAW